MKKLSIGFLFLLIVVIVGLLSFWVGRSTTLRGTDTPTDHANDPDTSVLFGGRDEAGYEFAGYYISLSQDGKAGYCGTTYLSPTVAISAAHCVNGVQSNFVGTGTFKFSAEGNYPVDANVKGGWDGKTTSNDFAVLTTKSGQKVNLNRYAEIAVPKVGCNYRIVAYGRTENEAGTGSVSPDRPRKSAQICITQMDSSIIAIKGSGGGMCHGDSGSPIFEEGSNKIVAVISAITAAPGQTKPECDLENTGLAVRVDANVSFINSTSGSSFRVGASSSTSGTSSTTSTRSATSTGTTPTTTGSTNPNIPNTGIPTDNAALIVGGVVVFCCLCVFGLMFLLVIALLLRKKQ